MSDWSSEASWKILEYNVFVRAGFVIRTLFLFWIDYFKLNLKNKRKRKTEACVYACVKIEYVVMD